MNSLEFINEQIEECKKVIDHLNIRIIEDSKYPSLIKSHNDQIENIKILQQQFQQIKDELEAWEIVKKDFILTWEEPNNASGYYLNYFSDCEYEKIKKALEVQYESRTN